ncbi:hypothetical protein QT397_16590 [Microbulbifer sp. MKSA007]|nr:hypothetical protein QT397_16590 [Microbulbifer sp. MKSA007]
MLISAFSSYAIADVQCGDTITDAQELSEALSCSEDPALTIEGPDGKLTMVGDGSVECTGSGAGILMAGSYARLTGGELRGCGIGVSLRGDGFHAVVGVTVEDSDDIAINVESDSNLIRQNTLSNSNNAEAAGIDVFGVRNVVVGNSISGFLVYGIIASGFFSNISNNNLQDNDLGIVLAEQPINGMSVGASFCVIASNSVLGSASYGIFIGGPYDFPNQDNVISGNTVTGSGLDDLLDDNEALDCSSGTNIWSGNTADTAFPSCLKDL